MEGAHVLHAVLVRGLTTRHREDGTLLPSERFLNVIPTLPAAMPIDVQQLHDINIHSSFPDPTHFSKRGSSMTGNRSKAEAIASRAAETSPDVSSIASPTDTLKPGRSWTVTSGRTLNATVTGRRERGGRDLGDTRGER